jgi:hypothetical protein
MVGQALGTLGYGNLDVCASQKAKPATRAGSFE